ncbi:hypothetical protein MTR_3g089420 [Medicago truncatula]|uniref:Uncharacterized protein n=1 Tax=Medicago truncatula TaxID=3880 RepID=G7ZWW1_MEDTR|nr:hypothetical protein MTR_3g089420 [Medicago truncatula]
MENKRYERWLIRHITVSFTSPPQKSERATATYDSSHLSGRCNRQYKVVPFVDPTYALDHLRKENYFTWLLVVCGDNTTPIYSGVPPLPCDGG